MPDTQKTVAVGMSGGVDSSVAAALLVEQGYKVIGIMLRLWSDPGSSAENACCTPDSMAIARRVAGRLGIPFYAIDAQDDFFSSVVQPFINGFAGGITPNPCLLCNRQIRWGRMLEEARNFGCDYLATGHYAQVIHQPGQASRLLKGLDQSKDQSYVLARLSQEQLSATILPLGGLTKIQVREIAHRYKFASADRPDSQDLCFLGNRSIQSFLTEHSPASMATGDIIDLEGHILGKHNGLPLYTIGQRKGIRVSADEPYYVYRKDMVTNTLIVTTRDQLGNASFALQDLIWTLGNPPDESIPYDVKIRYRAQQAECRIHTSSNGVRVTLTEPLVDITPGQAAVFYLKDEVIGSGIIAQP